ncbi:Mitochondrial assembly of ribosomal large subunit protein 1 [Halotydeus destructor]|nr:Mitochondrial assembly of ribosomal large subunit protein 1 [Halotydeus destructor]
MRHMSRVLSATSYRQLTTGSNASAMLSYCRSRALVSSSRAQLRRHFSNDNNGGPDDRNSSSTILSNDASEADSKEQENKIQPSTSSKFVPFEDEDGQTILDYHEEKYGVQEEEGLEESNFYMYRRRHKPGSRLTDWTMRRGAKGPFDVDNLVETLRSEKMKDIAVIKVMPDVLYCDHLVIATALSPRHMTAVHQYVVKLHKMNRRPSDPFLTVQGEKQSQDWRVVDMNHIVLHLFSAETREKYDLETLWCVGDKFDDKVQRPEPDALVDMMEKHIKYLEELQPVKEVSRPEVSI